MFLYRCMHVYAEAEEHVTLIEFTNVHVSENADSPDAAAVDENQGNVSL